MSGCRLLERPLRPRRCGQCAASSQRTTTAGQLHVSRASPTAALKSHGRRVLGARSRQRQVTRAVAEREPTSVATDVPVVDEPVAKEPLVQAEDDQQLLEQAPPTDNRWYTVVGLCAAAAVICSIDRAAISVAILPMAQEYGWDESTKGAISSAFFMGYTLTNVIGGYLSTTLGGKSVLGSGVVVWSLFTMLTPAAAATGSMPTLLAARLLMGCGEGVTFPCVQNLVKGWAPTNARSRCLALIYSGAQMGTIISLLVSPLIIQHLGWPAVFVLYGSIGFIWMAAWQTQVPVVTSHPVPRLEAQLQDLPWREFFSNKAFIAVAVAHGASGVGHYVALTWLPTYFNKEFGIDLWASAGLSVLPWICSVIANNASGWAADALINSRTLSASTTRKVLQCAGSVGPAACLLYLAYLGNQVATGAVAEVSVGQAATVMTAIVALGGLQSGGYASNHQDISTKYAPVLFGVTNALSSLTGSASVYATGVILDSTHSWSLVFALVAACYLVGAVVFAAWASGERQFD